MPGVFLGKSKLGARNCLRAPKRLKILRVVGRSRWSRRWNCRWRFFRFWRARRTRRGRAHRCAYRCGFGHRWRGWCRRGIGGFVMGRTMRAARLGWLVDLRGHVCCRAGVVFADPGHSRRSAHSENGHGDKNRNERQSARGREGFHGVVEI